jgi:RecA-family ATPase
MNVLYMGSEDSPSTTIVPRLTAAGAGLSRVSFFMAKRDNDGNTIPLAIPEDLELLRAVIAEKKIELIIIDPLVAFFGEHVDPHKDKEVRRALGPLFRLLDETGVTCIALRHLNKDSSKAVLYRGGGSIGITGQARSAFVATYHPEDNEIDDENARRRVLMHVKSNLAPKARALVYQTTEHTVFQGTTPIATSRIVWIAEATIDAQSAVDGGRHDKGPEATARLEAEGWLKAQVRHGAVPAAQLIKDAERDGHKEKTLRRAKDKLGVEAWQLDGKWVWGFRLTPVEKRRMAGETAAGALAEANDEDV